MRNLQSVIIFLAVWYAQAAIAQKIIPSIATEEPVLYIYIEGEKGNFPHLGLQNHFHYALGIHSSDTISIVSEKDSIAFMVEPEDAMIFDVVRQQGKDTLHCVFTIVEKQEHAYFSEAYIQSHHGKTFVEIPEVYELVNVIYALTPTGKTDRDIVRRDTPYYDEVMAYFGEYDQEPIVKTFDSLLKADHYSELKMDAYGFDFSEGNKIEKSDIYNIVSWGDYNTLAPYIIALEDFAKKSDFRTFYASHQPLYQKQIRTYQDTVDIHEMRVWLERNFPATKYNALKIIFSPLVNASQSSCNFESNGFKELQAHVNYPYGGQWLQKYPPEIATLIRGDIVFTELNHGYTDAESKKSAYQEDLKKAFQDMDAWIDMQKYARIYASPLACFNEYMNWALVSLRYADYAQTDYLPDMLANIENMMVNHRGFKKFPEFNQFLIKLYQSRKEDVVLADLYPQIIAWFIAN